MKDKIRYILSIFIFFVLIFLVALLIRPAYKNLRSGISDFAQEMLEQVEDLTSLKLSYKSLSPSILSAFYVKDIRLSDSSGTTVIKIDKVKLEYKLFKLIRGSLNEGFDALSADGVEVNVDAAIDVVKNFTSSDSKKGFDFSSFKAELPLDFVVKNVSLVYKKNNFTVDVNLKKAATSYVQRKKQLDVALNSSIKITLNKKSYTGNIGLTGSLFDSLENSTATLVLSNISDGTLKLNKMNFLFGFRNKVISGTTIQNAFPLRFSAEYDIVSQNANVNLLVDDFPIESIFSSTGRSLFAQKTKGLKVTSDTTLEYKVQGKQLSFESTNLVKMPSSLLPGGGTVKLAVYGDEKQLGVKELSLKGQNYDVSSNLNFTYKNLGLEGVLEIPLLVLPNETVISTEVYFDPLERGFTAFIPQVFIDEKAFTALEFLFVPNSDSFDFSFEGYDYSRFESGEPGKIVVDGSYLFSSNYVQTSLSLNSFYIESFVDTVALFLKPEKRQSTEAVSDKIRDFMFSGDAYFSTDFTSLSFNIPYIILANTEKDNQFLMLSFDGNEQSISLTQADLIFGKHALTASASLDRMTDSKDLFFSVDFNVSSIPYHFAGTFTEGQIRVSGDYDAEIELGFRNKENISGYVQFSNFPIPVLGTSIVSSLDAAFSYSKENGPEVNLKRLEVEEAGNKFSLHPHVAISGNATKYGAQFNSVTYTDLYSVLDGNADIVFNMFDGVFNSGGINMALKNPLSDEKITVEANISNPELMPFSLTALKNDFYIDSSIFINRFSLNRFTRLNSANNEVIASVFVTGTIEHPYISANVEKASVMISGNALTASASFLMEDTDISINELDVKYKNFNVNNVSGLFSLESFTGDMNVNIDGTVIEETLHIPLKVEVSDSMKEKSKFLPSSFTVSVSSDGIYGSFMKKKEVAFSASVLISPSMISLITSENIGLFGYYNKTGNFSFQLNSAGIAELMLNGTIENKTGKLEGKLSDVSIDLKEICSYFNFRDFIEVFGGNLAGNVSVKGALNNPEFMGAMELNNPNITLPKLFSHHVFTDKILIVFSDNEISVPEKKLKVRKNDEALGSCRIYLDKWKLDHLDAWIKTEKNRKVPVSIKNNLLSISGDASANLTLYLVGKDLEITGDVFAEKTEIRANLTKFLSSSENSKRHAIYTHCDINVALGTHVRVNIEPLLRCIFVPNASLQVQYEQRTGQVAMDGTLGLKSGDVSYLNRNFYIKDGSIKFTDKDDRLNPRITVRAETRERDADGDNVTIILTAENQQLTSFTPRFSSVPAKSENEIRTLLGQIAVADSDKMSNFLFAAGDYALQSTIGRKVENSLRDFLNFDILSLRTNVIQNVLGFSNINNTNGFMGNINSGNFWDVSTVYIGKYLGSSFYVDAMVHLQYDGKRIGENDKWANGFAFQPEFGFEIASPFANMVWNNDILWSFNFRLNVAPDINAMIQNRQFVPATSLSLSWKFSF